MMNEAGQARGQGEILIDPHRLASDAKLVARAVRERWPINPQVAEVVVDRLRGIVEKRTVDVMTKTGPAALDGPADANAARAAAVLVAMQGQNQADDHLADKNSRIDAGRPTELTGVAIRTPLTDGAYDDSEPADR